MWNPSAILTCRASRTVEPACAASLSAIGASSTHCVRRVDICARWGGDEFIILVRDCSATGLRQVAGALRDMMRQKPITIPNGETIAITISVGAVLVSPPDTLDIATDMADAALYAAKEEGRDRVVVFERARDRNEIGTSQDSDDLERAG